MNLKFLIALAMSATALATSASAGTTVTINGTDDIYNATAPSTLDGTNPPTLNVAGLSSLTFSDATGEVYLNYYQGATLNDADGVGAVPSTSSNTGANGIAGLTAPNGGYITGVFLGSALSATPTALNFSTIGTNFTSLSPALQQTFFIGDGLTGDGTGSTQTFFVPTGATTLALGISDACGYNGSPSCYYDNGGAFTITANGVSAAPEPSTWLLMIAGLGVVGLCLRRANSGSSVQLWRRSTAA